MSVTSIPTQRFSYTRLFVLLFFPLASLTMTILYFQLFPYQTNLDALVDAFFDFILTGVLYIVIVLFQKNIEYRRSRIPLLIGWSLIFFGSMDSALVELIDLSQPINESILTLVITSFHESPGLFFGLGGVFIIIGLYAWTQDTTASRRKFESTITAMPVAVAVIDNEDYVILHNQRFREIIDLPEREIINNRLSDLLKLELIESTRLVREEMVEPLEMEIIVETEDGQRKFLTVVIVENLDSDGNQIGHIITFTDVTMKRIAQEEREQGRRVIDLYASLLSHDIGNDLQAVMGYFEAAMLLMDVNREKAMEMLQSAGAAGERMSKLIKTFKTESIPYHIEIVPMLEEAASRAETASMGMKVALESEPGTRSLRSPGGSLLPVAIDNLLRNSEQHAGESPNVKIRVFTEEDKLVILFSDDGCGIPPDIRHRLFHRSDPSRESGLGLYLTQQLIIACGGTIELENSDNSTGTTFKIVLPIIE